MALLMPQRLATPEGRAGLYYTTMFLPPAVSTLLLPIWLDSKGIEEAQIGIVSALPILLMVVLNLVVGRVADRASDWRSVIVVCSLTSGAASLGLLIVDEFWGILFFLTLAVIPHMALEPVIDAAAMRMTRRRGTDFARVRIWGTIGFIGMTALAGWIFGWVGIAIFVPLFIATSIMRGTVSLALPKFRAPAGEISKAAVNVDAATTMREVLRPWFMLALVGTALLQASHMVLMTFGALLWARMGIPEGTMGVLWAVAPIFELITIFYFAKIARRFSARHILLVASIFGVLRWTGMTFATEIWQLALLQTLHMATFALAYMGIVSFIANWTSEGIAAEAQSFYVVLRQIATVLSLLAFGPLVAAFGNDAYYAAAAISAVGGVLILCSLAIMRTKR